MLQKLCIYNSKVFTTFDRYLIAYCYNKSESQDEHFRECLKIKIPAKCIVNEISLEVVKHHLTGLKSLIVVVFDLKSLCHAFIYNDSFRKKLYEIVLPTGPVAIEASCTRMFISDGPTFLFHFKDSIHLFSVPCRKNYAFDNLLKSSGSKENKILQFKCFGPFKTSRSTLRVLSLLIISYDFSSKQSIKIAGFLSDSKNRTVNFELLSLHLFFPRCYESVLKTFEVIKVLPCFKTESLSLKDIEWKEITTVICTKEECLVFFNAAILYCCKLTVPISKLMCFHSEFSISSSENNRLVLILENKTVFFIAIKNITCEVVKYWTDIEVALIGDILRKGSKHVLLLKESDIETWQNSCVLYDMSSFITVDLLCHNTMPDECLKTTITGLERKINVGKSVHKEVEHEISQKSAAIIDALIKLNDFQVNREWLTHSDIFQESLVDLILSKDENEIGSISPESEPSVKLLEIKQRFVNNHCVISLFFKNEGEKIICNPSIKALMKGSQVSSMQKLFVHSSENFSFCDKYSWQIIPKGRFTILLSFEFSTLFQEDVTLILTWYNGSTDEFDNEIFIKENRKVLVQHQLYLQTCITASDVMSHQNVTDVSSLSDILFLRASQQRTKLAISSLHSSISRLEEILISSDSHSKNLHLFQSSSAKCIVFINEKSLLFGVHIVIPKREQKMVEIEAYTKNETEILLLIQYLYEHLPDDIIISPCLYFKEEFSLIKREAANSMKSELDLIVSSLSIHNMSEEMRKNYSKLISSQMAGTIVIPKLIYNRIRRALVKREYLTDSKIKSFS